jgi:hypothetical protein
VDVPFSDPLRETREFEAMREALRNAVTGGAAQSRRSRRTDAGQRRRLRRTSRSDGQRDA